MQTNREWIAQAGLEGCSPALADAVILVDELRNMGKNLWIDGDWDTTENLTRYALRDALKRGVVPKICCERYCDEFEFFVWEAFGAVTATPKRGLQPWVGILDDHRTAPVVWVDGINCLSKQCLEFLSDVIVKRQFQKWGSADSIPLNCRWIVTTKGNDTFPLSSETWGWFFKRLDPLWIQVPPLNKRLEDIAVIIENVCNEHEKSVGYKRSFSRRTIEKITEQTWINSCGQAVKSVARNILRESGYKSVIEPWDFDREILAPKW